jgi:hypothetical protein
MAVPSFTANTDVPYECLDMFPITCLPTRVEEKGHECGILLKIWKTGGMFQTCVPLPEGALVELAPRGYAVGATITSCEQDGYGYFISFSINESQYDHWFPHSYCPPYLCCDEEERKRFADYDSTNW